MAEIYLASQQTAEGLRPCVIKMMRPESLRDPRALKLFLGEARLASQLENPHIVRIFDRDRVDNYHFIAMEYVTGETLYHIIHQAVQEQRRVEPGEAAAMILQVCEGLSYAHELRDPHGQPLHIVHRDITPANLILTYSGQLKILDFGIALARNRSLEVPKGKALGKFGYMSPEQCRSESMDLRTDIFSLGVVFWELLTGRSLFAGGSLKDLVESIIRGEIEPPSRYNAAVSPLLDTAILRSLERRPGDRFQSCRELALAIEEAFVDGGLASCEDLTDMLVELFGKRRRRLVLKGDVGAELDLEAMLFDDLDAEPPEQPTRSKQPKPGLHLSRLTTILLLVVVAVLAVGAGTILSVKLFGHTPHREQTPTSSYGSLVVDSSPRSARVFVDGQDSGRDTPARLGGIRMHALHEIRISKDGFEDWTGRVRLDQEMRRIYAQLRAVKPGITAP
ncbi:MAG: serine/threonine protein kinase [Deltaproteobacteria bacterium]|nr:serine/threonine protein kinase [Deltaproteobacteria bacterium]